MLEDLHLAPFHTWHHNAGTDGPRESQTDGGNATLIDAYIGLDLGSV